MMSSPDPYKFPIRHGCRIQDTARTSTLRPLGRSPAEHAIRTFAHLVSLVREPPSLIERAAASANPALLRYVQRDPALSGPDTLEDGIFVLNAESKVVGEL